MATQTTLTRTSGSLTPLCWLAGKYGTDKLGLYTPIYDLLLSGRRDRVFKVLEVGIGTPEAMKHVPCYRPGASLRMWRDYFPNADIFGLDINANACNEAADPDHRIFTFCAESANVIDVAQGLLAGGRFDLIVDDGNHEPKEQLRTFLHLSNLLTNGGFYIIEDVNAYQDENLLNLPVEYTYISHVTPIGTGRAIIVRQEALAI